MISFTINFDVKRKLGAQKNEMKCKKEMQPQFN